MASNNEEGKIALASEDATPANDIDPSLVTTGSPVEGGCVYTSFKANPTLPADAATKISTFTDLVSLGDLSPDGFTASKSVTVNEFKGWHQSIVLTKVSEEKHQYKMVFIESVRSSVAKLRYGAGNVETDKDGTFSHIKVIANSDVRVPLVIDELEDTHRHSARLHRLLRRRRAQARRPGPVRLHLHGHQDRGQAAVRHLPRKARRVGEGDITRPPPRHCRGGPLSEER